jgi:hypothetical protein
MPTGRTFRVAVVAAAVALAAAAAIVLNLALLGYAQPRNDPVGKLSPRAALLPSPATTQVPTVPETAPGEADD